MGSLREKFIHFKKTGEMGIVAFIMSLLPDEKLCLDCIKALEQGGCDVLELGMPFSDPLADGEIIERLHHRGVEKGLNLARGLEFACKVKEMVEMPIIIFTYFNPVYQMGIKNFKNRLAQIGAEAVIVPDLPLEELVRLKEEDMETVPLIAPSTPEARMKKADDFNPPFVYCVSVRGTTGLQNLDEEEIKEYLLRVRNNVNSPLALGFGISSPEQVKKFSGYTDAVVVGSLLASIIEEHEANPGRLPGELENTIKKLKKASFS